MSLLTRLLLAIALSLALAGAAFAHAAMIAATPAQGKVLAAAPSQFTLAFNEPVSPLVLNLVSPDGSVARLEGATFAANTLTVPAPADLGTGSFLLSYRVVSEDGHPIGGTVQFAIGAPSASGPAVDSAPDWPVLLAIWAAKLLLYLALFVGIGGTLFRHWTAPGSDAGRRLGIVALILGLIAAPLSLGLQGLDALDLPLTALLRLEVWSTGAATSLGPSAAIAFVALLLALVAERSSAPAGRLLALLAFAGIGATLASTGHASSASPHWLIRTAVFLHASSIAFWVGALLPLWLLLKTNAPAATPALRRFSAAIPLALVVLVLAGITLAVVQLGSPAAVWQTAYGRVLLAKLALVALVLLLAAINRWRLTRSAEAAKPGARQNLARIILAETLLLFAVFGVVALWRFTPPPRAIIAAPPPLSVMLHGDTAMASITFASSTLGANAADITITGAPDAQSLTLSLANRPAGIEPTFYPATATAPGLWHVPAILLPTPGTWTIQIDLRISDFDQLTLAGQTAFPADTTAP